MLKGVKINLNDILNDKTIIDNEINNSEKALSTLDDEFSTEEYEPNTSNEAVENLIKK